MQIRNQTPFGSIEILNQNFFGAVGPANYFITRLQILLAIAGAQQDQMIELLMSELDYAGIGLKFSSNPSMEFDDQIASSQRLIDQFVRVESHLLKHHVIETLLRHYLANIGNPACPWMAISSETSFRRFKARVRQAVLDECADDLRKNVAWLFLGVSLEKDGADRLTRVAENLACFLKTFAKDWLNTSIAHNSSKHGMTAIPGDDEFSIDDIGPRGFGDSLTYLEYAPIEGGWRKWSKTTDWLPVRKTILSAFFGAKMLQSLWGVAGVRAGSLEDCERFAPDPDQLTPNVLDSSDAPSLRSLSIELFEEKIESAD